MTFNTVKARQDLLNKIAKRKSEREQQRLLKISDGTGCDHDKKLYRQNIEIDWNAEAMRGQSRTYSGPLSPYFLVYGCTKCKKKWYVDMKS